MSFYDSFEMGLDYEKNRLKYFKEDLIISKIIKSVGGIGAVINLGLIANALSTNVSLKDLDGIGAFFFAISIYLL